MNIAVRFFASCREAVQQNEATLELPEGSCVADLQRELARRFPPLAGRVERVRYAVNGTYAQPGDPLNDGDEAAVIPPVAGG